MTDAISKKIEIKLPAGHQPLRLRYEHFNPGLSDAFSMELFKDTVTNVAIGISSYCNRSCAYCPNSLFDRKSGNNYMKDEVFFNIIYQLAKIDYSGKIQLHRYNEPMADSEYLIRRVCQVRSTLPRAWIQIHTNGDFLRKDMVQTLASAGANQLDVTTHATKCDKDFDAIKNRLAKRLKKFGLPFTYVEDSSFCKKADIQTNSSLSIVWSAKNLFSSLLDRGETFVLPSDFRRTDPCRILFTELEVEWDGSVVPCCNISIDNPRHKNFVLGKVEKNSSIFKIWTNKNFATWRRNLLNYNQKNTPCTSCWYGHIDDTPENREAILEACRQLVGQNT